MRHNFFGEPIAQMGDDYDHVAWAFEQHYGAAPKFTTATIYLEADPHLKFGGAIFHHNGDSIDFDGFETLNEAREWLRDTIGILNTAIMEEE